MKIKTIPRLKPWFVVVKFMQITVSFNEKLGKGDVRIDLDFLLIILNFTV